LNRGPIVTPNESELSDLVTLLGSDGDASAQDAASRIEAVSHQPVVVTQGADGVLLVTGDSVVHVPAPSVSARDTTGAGDTFNGVLAGRLAAGDDLGAAVPYAVAAAALSVTAVGARGGMPTAAAIEAALTT
jgi:ribokinase